MVLSASYVSVGSAENRAQIHRCGIILISSCGPECSDADVFFDHICRPARCLHADAENTEPVSVKYQESHLSEKEEVVSRSCEKRWDADGPPFQMY